MRLGWDHQRETALLTLPNWTPQHYPRARRLTVGAYDPLLGIIPALPLGIVILRAAGCRITYNSRINNVLTCSVPITGLSKMVGNIPERSPAVPPVGRSDYLNAVTSPVVSTVLPSAFQEFNLPYKLGLSLQLYSLGRPIAISQNHEVIGYMITSPVVSTVLPSAFQEFNLPYKLGLSL
jgi:hypothetical protein